jgi:hypothetical protein
MSTRFYNLRDTNNEIIQTQLKIKFDHDVSAMLRRMEHLSSVDNVDNKVLLIIKLFKYIDKNGRLSLTSNKYLKFQIIFKNKLIDFKNIGLSKHSKQLKTLSLKLLKKWFGENHTHACCAIKKNNMLCDKLIMDDTVNIIHNVCILHKNYPLKILNILDKYFLNNISKNIILPMIF